MLPRTTLYFDSAHYLESAKRLYETFADGSNGLSKDALDSLAFYLMLDGPVLPGAAALVFFVSNKTPALTEWSCLVAMQCFFQAVCASFVFLLGLRLLQNRLLAAIASVLWITYPPAISSCNSLLTEPLACALSIGFIFFLTGFSDSSGKIDYCKSFLAGTFAMLLCLLKPALAPTTGLIALVAFTAAFYQGSASARFSKTACLKLLCAGIGIALVLLPWLSFTYAARGKLTLLPSRRPVYNICTGLNSEGDGWGTYPTHPLALMFDDNEAALPVALALIESDPVEITNLTLRKTTRLFNLPWNDYRYKILGLTFRLQALLHLLLITLGLSGFALLFAEIFGKTLDSKQKLLTLSMLIFLCGHLIYLPFEGISRYGFTAMPCFVLASMYLVRLLLAAKSRPLLPAFYLVSAVVFISLCKLDLIPFILLLHVNAETAVCIGATFKWFSLLLLCIALWMLARSKSEFTRPSKIALATALSSISLLGAAITAAFAISSHEAPGWQCKLKHGDAAARSVEISGLSQHKPEWALLMLDGDQRVSNAQFFVNGHRLEAPESIYQFYTEQYELNEWLNQFASLIRRDPGNLRRWRATAVPLDALTDGWNSLECCGPVEGEATVYGDYLERSKNGRRVLPSSNEVSPGKFFNDSEEGFDSRIMQSTCSSIGKSKCDFEHDLKRKESDLSPSHGIQIGNYRMYLLLGFKSPAPKKSGSAGYQPASNQSPPPAPSKKTSWNNINNAGKLILSPGAKTKTINLLLTTESLDSTHIRVSVKAESKSTAGSTFTVAGVVEKGESLIASVLPGSPFIVNSLSEWKPFEFSSELPVVTVKGKKPELRIELNAVAADTEIKNLQIQVEPLNKPQFSGHSIKVF